MLCQYQIISYIPCFGLSRELIQHYWIWHKIANQLKYKMFVPLHLIQKMSKEIVHLDKQRSFCYSDYDISLFLEYQYENADCFFKIQWFMIIYS